MRPRLTRLGIVRDLLDFVIVEQDPIGRPVQILELPGPQGPQESDQPKRTENQGDWNQHQQIAHQILPRESLSALVMTTTEEVDMEIAAIKGVTIPAMASGMVNRL